MQNRHLKRILLSLFCMMTAFSQTLPDITFRTRIGGWPDGAWIKGNYVYLVQAMQLSIIEIGQESMTKKGALLLDSEPAAVTGSEDLIVLVSSHNDSGIQIIDISDPGNPADLGRFAIPTTWPVSFLAGQNAHFLISGETLYVLASDLRQPEIIRSITIDWTNCMAVSNDALYLGGLNGLSIYTISDPQNPQFVKTMPFLTITTMAAGNGYLYLGINGSDKAVTTLDLTDPLAPLQTDTFEPKHTEGFSTWIKNPDIMRISQSNLFMAASGGNACLFCFDLSDPAKPSESGYIEFEELNYTSIQSILIVNQAAWLVTTQAQALMKVDIGNPAEMMLTDTYLDVNTATAFCADGADLYVSGMSHLFVYNVSDGRNPVLTASDARYGNLFRMVFGNGHVYAVRNDSLLILDTSDPENITLTGSRTVQGDQIRGIALHQQTVLLQVHQNAGNGSIDMIDVSNGAAPAFVKSFMLPGLDRTLDIREDGSVAFAGYHHETNGSGVQILNLTDAAIPDVIANVPSAGRPIAVASTDTLLYIASLPAGGQWCLESFSTAAITHPEPMASRTGTGTVYDLQIQDGMLYVSLQGEFESIEKTGNPAAAGRDLSKNQGDSNVQGHLVALDMLNLFILMDIYMNNPLLFLFILGLALYGPFAIFACGYMNPGSLQLYASLGMFLMGINNTGAGIETAAVPTEHAIVRNYPNPFNPETTIEYTVAEPCRVRVQVIDLKGHRLQTLTDAPHAAGTYRLNFSAHNLPSGIYMVQVMTGSQIMTRKMMLIR